MTRHQALRGPQWRAHIDLYAEDGSPRRCEVMRGDTWIGSAAVRTGLDPIANVHLFAAAPDLLEALRVTAGNIRSLGPAGALDQVPMPYVQWLAMVEAAVAKAEGREVLR